MPRSGTTLVERIVSNHPQVASAGEALAFPLCTKRLTRTASSRVLDAATLTAAAAADAHALGAAYLQAVGPIVGDATRFVDKLPVNFFYAGLIHGALPDARIICVRRDPLDTCVSNFRAPFALGFRYYDYAYSLADIGRYYVGFDRLMAHWRRVLPEHFLSVDYEALVTEPATETRRILDFCGLGWNDACLRFEHNPLPVASASAAQVREPLHQNAIGRWRHYERYLGPLREALAKHGVLA